MAELEEFLREMKKIEKEVPRATKRVLDDMVIDAYAFVIERSPVDTGAYRAEHIIGTGLGGAITRIVYEAPGRVGPETLLPTGGTPLAAPDAQAARLALVGSPVGPSVTILNQRFYASYLEYGTATQAPLQIYETAAALANARPPVELDVGVR